MIAAASSTNDLCWDSQQPTARAPCVQPAPATRPLPVVAWMPGSPNQAVHDVAELTDDPAVSVVQPALTDSMAASPGRARGVHDPLVRHWLGGVGEMVRVKIWTARGTVLYSDEPRPTGQAFPLDGDSRAALLRPRTEADITDLSRPENRDPRPRPSAYDIEIGAECLPRTGHDPDLVVRVHFV